MAKKAFMDKKAQQFMEEYLNNVSPTSHEWTGQKIWLKYLKPYVDECRLDNYGTAYGIINPKAKYKVVLEAHADEISWMVKYVSKEGFIYVTRNGGSDHMIAPSKRVNIHTPDGVVKGVFGWPAIHMRNRANEEKPSVNNLFIDVGCHSKEEVLDLGIHIGAQITYDEGFMEMNNRYYAGRALDNRMGGFMIAQVARMIHENKDKIPFGLYFVNSVMEEVGLQGARMIVDTIRPNVAIITDVAHDTTTPMIEVKEEGEFKCGDGPLLSYAPAVHNNLLKLIMDAAKTNKIPYQVEAISRATGTDTDAFAFSVGGVVSALVSLPLRYMHTTVEMVHKDDVENVSKLMYESVKKIKNNQDFRYFKP